MTRDQGARVSVCLAIAGAAVSLSTAAFAGTVVHHAEDPPAGQAAATAQPTVEVPDTLGPTTDDEDDGGLGTAPAVGLGAAACALIAGGFFLRRHGRH